MSSFRLAQFRDGRVRAQNLWRSAFHLYTSPAERVCELQSLGVQVITHIPRERLRGLNWNSTPYIEGIPNQGMPDCGKMDAYLVGPPREYPYLHKGPAGSTFKHPDIAQCRFPGLGSRIYGPEQLVGYPPDGDSHAEGIFRWTTAHKGTIDFGYTAPAPTFREPSRSLGIPAEEHQA